MPLCAALFLAQGSDAGPLEPAEERASFRTPPGFAIELVISEPRSPKIVDIAFDDAGRMWAVTASEYPLDGNEDARAAELYARGGRDQVLVVDRPWEGVRCAPRVFADGLAMPMSVLPLPEGALIQHGSEILRLVDGDGDGRADRREVVLSGFGIQDSHLMPHRFLRGPDGWIYTAQGAFNSSLVRDRSGRETRFEQCKLARFTRDGARFEVVGVGLNNIWGLVFDERGEFLIQEANDMGYGVVPFVHGASYPGIGQDRLRPYAPLQPPGSELRFGGTGLSGLALCTSERGFPAPYAGALLVANPILRVVQAVRRSHPQSTPRFELVTPLVESSDPRFRPVAVHFGPDDALYVVDWYNPIISHNEVPRTHPDRDRVRTRVWRVRHESQPPYEPRDMTRESPAALLAALESPSMAVARAAWHQIVDRALADLAPQLAGLARDGAKPVGARALALWSLEGLRSLDAATASALLRDPDPALRRAALRGFAASGAGPYELLALAPDPGRDADVEVRCEWLRTLGASPPGSSGVVQRLLERVPAPDERDSVRCEQDGVTALTGASLAAARERTWIRMALEPRHHDVERWIDASAGAPPEARALAALELGGEIGAVQLALALAALPRPALPEELALCALHAAQPDVLGYLSALLGDPQRARGALEALTKLPPRELDSRVRAQVCSALDTLADRSLSLRMATALELRELAPSIAAAAADPASPRALRREALRALARLEWSDPQLFMAIADSCLPGDELQSEALFALCALGLEPARAAVLARVDDVPATVGQRILRELSLTTPGARAVLDAVAARRIGPALCNERVIEALRASLGNDPALGRALTDLAPAQREVLVLSGGPDDCVETALALEPPFTIEAWVQLDPDISNRDGILANGRDFDLNFAGALPRLWLGPTRGDALIARTPLEAGRWTHVALTASRAGSLALYLDGELDQQAAVAPLKRAEGLDVGRTTPGGPSLLLAEVRVWSRERSPREVALDARRVLDGARPEGLALRVPGDPVQLGGGARIESRRDVPQVLDQSAHDARRARFERFAALAGTGDPLRGQPVFERVCQVCHSMGGRGESVGPPLDGVGMRGVEGLLTSILEPSAAVESGYRELLVELRDEPALAGLLVREDDATLTLRPLNGSTVLEARTLPRAELARTRWSKLSAMPEGLLETLPEAEAADLLAFLAAQR